MQSRAKGRIRRVAAVVGICTLGAISAPSASSADWPQFHRDAARSGFNPVDNELNHDNVDELALKWRTSFGGVSVTTPVVAAGAVYVGSSDGSFYALDAQTGAVRWRGAAGESIGHSAAVVGDRVYVGSLSGTAYAFPTNCSTPCEPLWMTPTNGRITSAPAVSDGVVYVGAARGTDGELWALDAATGAVLWSAPLSSSPTGVAVADGIVYTAYGSLVAFPTACATPCQYLWLGQNAEAPPAVGGGFVLSDARFVNTAFRAFAATSACSIPCPAAWTGATNAGTTRVAAVTSSTAYLTDGAGVVSAFPLACSSFCIPLWTAAVGALSEPVVANGILYVGTSDGVKTLDALSGAEISTIINGLSTLGPAIVGGTLFVSGVSVAEGRIEAYALNPVDTGAPVLTVPDDITVVAPDAVGTFVSFDVSATDNVDPSPVVVCEPPSTSFFAVGSTTVICTATDASGNSDTASFVVTVLPAWSFAIHVQTKATVDPRTGVVTLVGTITCNRSGALTLYGMLEQVVARRAIVRGWFFTSVNCEAPATPWTAYVQGESGRFAPGGASVTIDGWGCEFTCHSAQTTADLRLVASRG